MSELSPLRCCGMGELANIHLTSVRRAKRNRKPEDMLHEAFKYDHSLRRGALIFTEAGNRKKDHYGERLAQFITEKGLGEVTELPPFKNPNTRRQIRTWFWRVDRPAFRKWLDLTHEIEPMEWY